MSNRGNGYQIWIVSLDGGALQPVPLNWYRVQEHSVSRDGKLQLGLRLTS